MEILEFSKDDDEVLGEIFATIIGKGYLKCLWLGPRDHAHESDAM